MNKFLLGLGISTALVGAAYAQTWTHDGDNEFVVHRATAITSTSNVTALELESPKNTVWATMKGSTNNQITINGKLSDGTVLVSQSMNVTTAAQTVSFSAPQPFTHMTFTPSTTQLSGTNNTSVTVVESRAL